MPLLLELAADVSHPLPPGVVASVLFLGGNILNLTFVELLTVSHEYSGTFFGGNVAIASVSAASTILLFFWKPVVTRGQPEDVIAPLIVQ
jgi:hypothetical protein